MNEEIKQIARQLYLRLPWWKRWQYRRWHKTNNWDVKDIYTSCLREARAIIKDEAGFNY